MNKTLNRRKFFQTAVAGSLAASTGQVALGKEERRQTPVITARYTDYLVLADTGKETEPITEDNIEGPFFRANAPLKTTLYAKGDKGEILVISGKVVARNGRPLADAMIEVWQASPQGRYDNDDPKNPPAKDEFRFRARLKTDKNGLYKFETMKPVAYSIGPNQYRPAHIHVKVHHEGYDSLTTQLYFPEDKYNKKDPWYKPSLVLDLKKDGKKLAADFKFVLAKT